MKNLSLLLLVLITLASCSGGGAGSLLGDGIGDTNSPSGGGGGGGDGGGNNDTTPGGGGDDETTSSSSLIPLSGVAQLGLVDGAFVQAIEVDDLGNVLEGQYCSDPVRSENGVYTIMLDPKCKNAKIVFFGGSYIDEATGDEIDIDVSQNLSTLITDITPDNVALMNEQDLNHINGLTELLTERALAAMQAGFDLTEVLEAARVEIEEMIGVDPKTPVATSDEVAGAQADDPRVKALAIVAGLSQAAKEQCPNNSCDQISLIKAMGADLRDGKMDGKIGENNIDELTDNELIDLGLKAGAVNQIRDKALAARTDGTVDTSFIGHKKRCGKLRSPKRH